MFGGGGGGGGGNFLYMASYGCACRMTPFFSAARYMISPLFQQKVYDCMTDLIFLDSYVKGPTFLTSRCMRIFFIRDFSRLLVLLVVNEMTVIFVELPAINGYKNQRAVYE